MNNEIEKLLSHWYNKTHKKDHHKISLREY